MPIPAILGRIGSGAKTTTRRVTAAKRSRGPPAHPLQKKMQLPGARAIDLRKDAVEPRDLRLDLRDLAVVFLIAREELCHARVSELVLGEKAVSFGLEIGGLGRPRGDFPLELFNPLLYGGELRGELRLLLPGFFQRRVQAPVALALVAQLSLRDAVPFRAKRDLRAQPVQDPRESLLGAPARIACVDFGARPLERGLARGHVERIAVLSFKDPVLACHGTHVPEGGLEGEPDQEVPILRVLELLVEPSDAGEEPAR